MLSSRPFWLDTVTEEDFRPPGAVHAPALPGRAAIAIIGGGIVGLACAAYLSRAGVRDVLLLERDTLLCEASAGNAGGLWHTEQAKGAGIFHTLGQESQRLLRRFIEETGVEVHYRRTGVLQLARSEEDVAPLVELVRKKQAAGLVVEWLDAAEVLEKEPHLAPDQVFGAAWFPEDCHVNPARLGAAFAREAQRLGARLVTGTAVENLERGPSGIRLQTPGGAVDVDRVVVTTGAWAGELGRNLGLHVPVVPAKGQMVATEAAPPLLNHAVIGPLGVLQTATGEILSGGTVEFVGFDREAQAETRERIWTNAVTLVPALAGRRLTHSWARLRPHTPDELPLLGPCDAEGRCLIAAGHFRNGLLLAAVTGKIITDLLTLGRTGYPPGELDPRRFSRETTDV